MAMDLHESSRSQTSLAAVTVVAILLQAALAPQISLFGGTINFMLILAAVYAFSGNASRAVLAGFLCGLFYDLTASVPVGLMTLLLTIGSFVLANSSAAAIGASSQNTYRLVAVFCFAVCMVYGVALVIMGIQSDLVNSLLGHGLSTAILSALVSVPFFLASGTSDSSRRGFSAKSKGSRFKGIR